MNTLTAEIISMRQGDSPIDRIHQTGCSAAYPNEQAFLANLAALHDRTGARMSLLQVVHECLIKPEDLEGIPDLQGRESEVREAWLIGAAQWFLWDIDATYKRWRNTEDQPFPAHREEVRWSVWARRFRELAQDQSTYSAKGRGIALRAAQAIEEKLEADGPPHPAVEGDYKAARVGEPTAAVTE